MITGGEPLQHPGIAPVLAGLPRLGFRGVILTQVSYRQIDVQMTVFASEPGSQELTYSADPSDIRDEGGRWLMPFTRTI